MERQLLAWLLGLIQGAPAPDLSGPREDWPGAIELVVGGLAFRIRIVVEEVV